MKKFIYTAGLITSCILSNLFYSSQYNNAYAQSSSAASQNQNANKNKISVILGAVTKQPKRIPATTEYNISPSVIDTVANNYSSFLPTVSDNGLLGFLSKRDNKTKAGTLKVPPFRNNIDTVIANDSTPINISEHSDANANRIENIATESILRVPGNCEVPKISSSGNMLVNTYIHTNNEWYLLMSNIANGRIDSSYNINYKLVNKDKTDTLKIIEAFPNSDASKIAAMAAHTKNRKTDIVYIIFNPNNPFQIQKTVILTKSKDLVSKDQPLILPNGDVSYRRLDSDTNIYIIPQEAIDTSAQKKNNANMTTINLSNNRRKQSSLSSDYAGSRFSFNEKSDKGLWDVVLVNCGDTSKSILNREDESTKNSALNLEGNLIAYITDRGNKNFNGGQSEIAIRRITDNKISDTALYIPVNAKEIVMSGDGNSIFASENSGTGQYQIVRINVPLAYKIAKKMETENQNKCNDSLSMEPDSLYTVDFSKIKDSIPIYNKIIQNYVKNFIEKKSRKK